MLEGQTVNQTYYKELLITLRERVQKKRNMEKSFLDPSSRQCIGTQCSIDQAFLAKHDIPVLEHSSYFPDLVPFDFLLFLNIKSTWKQTHFQSRCSKEKNDGYDDDHFSRRSAALLPTIEDSYGTV